MPVSLALVRVGCSGTACALVCLARRGGSWIVLCATLELGGVLFYPALLTLAAVSCICVTAC